MAAHWPWDLRTWPSSVVPKEGTNLMESSWDAQLWDFYKAAQRIPTDEPRCHLREMEKGLLVLRVGVRLWL